MEPLSPCERCGKARAELPVCACGALQEPPDGLSYFALLGEPETMGLDEEKLRNRFYELSKLTHPDRFAQASPAEASRSLRWTTALNRAYQTLRDREKRARYLLELRGRQDKKDSIPFDLAEAYFEIQDADDPARLEAFRGEMSRLLDETEQAWGGIGDDLDRLSALLVKLKYLRSMIADIDRKLGVTDGDRRH